MGRPVYENKEKKYFVFLKRMRLSEAYGGRHLQNAVPIVPPPDIRSKRKVKKNRKLEKKNDNIFIKLGKSLEKTLGNSVDSGRPVYLIQMQVAQDDCHLICMFILVFLISLILTRK